MDRFQKLDWPRIKDRARAAFIGVALGDALGATTEFMTPREIKVKFGGAQPDHRERMAVSETGSGNR